MTERQFAELQALFETEKPAELGPEPREGRKSTGEIDHALDKIFAGPQKGTAAADGIRALLFLWHDHLDQSHTISQDIHSADGSFIHGILHRREPDYGNAKYWFNRVGRHSAFPVIVARIGTLAGNHVEKKLIEILAPGGEWDPFAFIDACERVAQTARDSSEEVRLLERIQKMEFSVLLEQLAEQVREG